MCTAEGGCAWNDYTYIEYYKMGAIGSHLLLQRYSNLHLIYDIVEILDQK